MAGRVKLQQERWREAVAAFEAAVALALKVRPEGGAAKPPVWSESDEEDFAAALRYLPIIQWRRLNDVSGARASLERALKLLPQDGPLRALAGQMKGER
jgi:tetratricopeptide (TPR) repeat protein